MKKQKVTTQTEEKTQEEKFAAFMQKVDAILYNKIGLTHEDLDDFTWMDCFMDGTSIRDTVDDFLDYIGYDE